MSNSQTCDYQQMRLRGSNMSNYGHKKGAIKDNAIEALLHDPLFRQRVELNAKGKGSYRRKGKHRNVQKENWEASGKIHFLPLVF